MGHAEALVVASPADSGRVDPDERTVGRYSFPVPWRLPTISVVGSSSNRNKARAEQEQRWRRGWDLNPRTPFRRSTS